MTDLIVIGAGASGISAAIRAAERNLSVLLLEKGDRIGRKILASGNGRCNLMNSGALRYHGDTGFAEQVMTFCPREKIERFFLQYGLIVTEETEGRMYPASFQSASVLSVMKDALAVRGVKLRTGSTVESISQKDGLFSVSIKETDIIFKARRVVVACGGPAQPSAGGTDDGLRLLRNTGHLVIPAKPALVPLTTDRKSISGLSGLRVRCRVSVVRGSSAMHREEGEILFTDYGVSGICVMQCSRYASEPDTVLEADFLYRIFSGPEKAAEELRRRREMFGNLSPVCLLDGILPDKLSYAVMKQAGIPLRGEKAGDLTEAELKRIAAAAFGYRIKIEGTRGLEYAQVTAGGADCAQFDPATMASRVCPGLYATGEVLNVDGDCGGFNLMFAFATGLLAGESV